jgi:hypothetical protein
MDIPLAGVLRTILRSESSNSFFNRFIQKLCFIEFWLRFDMTLEFQRHDELKANHISIHSTPLLHTPWLLRNKQAYCTRIPCSTYFKKEVIAARDHYSVLGTTQQWVVKLVIINDGSMRNRVVEWCTSNNFDRCSCKLFEKMRISCCHIILTLRGEKLYELHTPYILKR